MSRYSQVLQIPGKLVTVTSSDSNISMGGAFTIAWANADAIVVATPADGGDTTITLNMLAGSSCPVAVSQIVSTTADIIIGK
jgi:hypothetical protein